MTARHKIEAGAEAVLELIALARSLGPAGDLALARRIAEAAILAAHRSECRWDFFDAQVMAGIEARIIPEPNSGCWLWLGRRTPAGYGFHTSGNKRFYIHRMMWEKENGPIPKGMSICHKCDFPTCCNPDHLFSGTTKENVQDAIRKGRRLQSTHGAKKSHLRKISSAATYDV